MGAAVIALGRPIPILCLVTPGPQQCPSGLSPEERATRLASLIGDAVKAGVDLVQVREPRLPARMLAEIVGSAVVMARETHTRIIVNDRVDVALAIGADGVQLGARSLPAGRVREIAPPGFLIGQSIHSVEEAAAACAGGAVDFVVAGTVFRTASKPGEPRLLGADGLAEVVRTAALPVLAIGGIHLDAIPLVARAHAAGFAAIRLFGDAHATGTLTETVKRARSLFDTTGSIS